MGGYWEYRDCFATLGTTPGLRYHVVPNADFSPGCNLNRLFAVNVSSGCAG